MLQGRLEPQSSVGLSHQAPASTSRSSCLRGGWKAGESAGKPTARRIFAIVWGSLIDAMRLILDWQRGQARASIA